MKLTLDQFVKQWVKNGTPAAIVSQLEKNIFEFTTLAGENSKAFFVTSFLAGGFYGSGKKWEMRKSRNGRKYTHPILLDSGKLKIGIKGEGKSISRDGRKDNGQRIFKRGAKYEIRTTEKSVAEKGKRTLGKNKYINYAAIHNSDPQKTNFKVNKHSNKKPVQRQFIGLNKELDSHVAKFIPIIFRDMP